MRTGPEDPPGRTLREAIDTAARRDSTTPDPLYSPDGGITLADHWGRAAWLQPLGARTRVSLSDAGVMTAEGEVDTDELIAGIAHRENPYDAAADALDDENGPGYRSR